MPLYQYPEIVRRQRLNENWLSPELLKIAFQHLVVEQDILSQIGPAVNSNKSFLFMDSLGTVKPRSPNRCFGSRMSRSICPMPSNARVISSRSTIPFTTINWRIRHRF